MRKLTYVMNSGRCLEQHGYLHQIRYVGLCLCRPVKNKKIFFMFLFWNLNWNWNWDWDWSWNDLRECQKLWGGLCILYRTCRHEGLSQTSPFSPTWHLALGILVREAKSPPISYEAKYTSLPRVFDTPSSHSNFNSNSNPNLNSKFTKFNEIYPTCHLPYLSLKSNNKEYGHNWMSSQSQRRNGESG